MREEHLPDQGAEGLADWFQGFGFELKIKKNKYNAPVRTLTFEGHRYELYNTHNHYDAAAEFAASKGGHVLVIEEEEEAEWLEQNFQTRAWLAANDKETEGEWVWTAGPLKGEQFWMTGFGASFSVEGHFAAWAEGEPNDVDNEDCAIMEYEDGVMVWRDMSCMSKLPLLVEYEPAEETEHSEL